ncbi:MAG: RNA-binding protein [Marinilabiliales bacterium]
MNIYVGNLDYNLKENQLEEIFSEYGEVSSVKIIRDRDTGRAKGFGFIEMPDDNEAQSAMDALNGFEVNGRSIRVSQAKQGR